MLSWSVSLLLSLPFLSFCTFLAPDGFLVPEPSRFASFRFSFHFVNAAFTARFIRKSSWGPGINCGNSFFFQPTPVANGLQFSLEVKLLRSGGIVVVHVVQYRLHERVFSNQGHSSSFLWDDIFSPSKRFQFLFQVFSTFLQLQSTVRNDLRSSVIKNMTKSYLFNFEQLLWGFEGEEKRAN